MNPEQNTQVATSVVEKFLGYSKETTRVHNKRIAPTGKIFLVVRYKHKMGSYQCSLLVPTAGLTDDLKADVYNRLCKHLQDTYSL